MKTRITLLIALNFALLLSWGLFSSKLSNDKVDLFLFFDLEQKPFWYVYYTSQYLREIVYAVIIYYLVPNGYSSLRLLSLFLIGINSIRLVVYWLFRSSISIDVLVVCVLIYSILSLIKWPNLR